MTPIEHAQIAQAAEWAALGHAGTAESVARSIVDPVLRAQALVRVVVALAGAGLVDRAESIARSIAEPDMRARALQGLVQALVDTGRVDRAAAVAGSIVEQAARPDRPTAVVDPGTVLDVNPANLRTALVDADKRRPPPAPAPVQPTGRERLERIKSLTAALVDPHGQAELLGALAGLVVPDQQAAAESELADLRTAVRAIPEQDRREYALGKLAELLTGIGRLDLAEPIARAIAVPDRRSAALCVLARRFVRTGQRDAALPLLAEAESLARDTMDPARRARALRDLVGVLAVVGDCAHAESVARGIDDPVQQGRALTRLARAVADEGRWDRAVGLARDIVDEEVRGRALADLAIRAADDGRFDQAEALAWDIPNPGLRVRTLGGVTDRMGRA